MKKLLSIFALAATNMALPLLAQAKLPVWNDGLHEAVMGEIEQQSCSDNTGGKQFTYSVIFSVVSDKSEWDRALAGKSKADESQMFNSYMATAKDVIARIWPPAIKGFLPDDMGEGTSPYTQARNEAWRTAESEITQKTGIKTIVGFEDRPESAPGCTLK